MVFQQVPPPPHSTTHLKSQTEEGTGFRWWCLLFRRDKQWWEKVGLLCSRAGAAAEPQVAQLLHKNSPWPPTSSSSGSPASQKRRVRGTRGRCPLRYQASQILMISICRPFWWVLLLQVPVRAIIQAVLWGRCPQQALPQNSLINLVLLQDALGFWFEAAFHSPSLLLFYSLPFLDHSVLSSILGGSRSDLSLHSETAPDHGSHGVLPGGDKGEWSQWLFAGKYQVVSASDSQCPMRLTLPRPDSHQS